MDKRYTQAKVWKEFEKIFKEKGFMFLEASPDFRKELYRQYIKARKEFSLSIEEFVDIFIMSFEEDPIRAIDNTIPMKPSS
jgi:hypothetical protein